MLRDAAGAHAGLLVVLRGETRAILVCNLSAKLMYGGTLGRSLFLGGIHMAEYLLSRGRTFQDKNAVIDAATGIAGSSTSDRTLVFSCPIVGADDLRLNAGTGRGLCDPEFVFEGYLDGTDPDVRYVGEDVCGAAAGFDLADVIGVVGYERYKAPSDNANHILYSESDFITRVD